MKIINSRAAFLSGASTRAAILLSLGAMGLALPATAHAQDECDPAGQNPSANGAAADAYVCTQTAYPGGITYNSNGNLTVTTNVSGNMQTGPNGVKLTGNGSDAVNWVSAGTTVLGQGDKVIDITTQSGAITVNARDVRGVSGTTTGLIRAVSQSGGAVSLNLSGLFRDVGPGATTVEAVSQGGNGNVSVTYNASPVLNVLDFTQRGIYARAAGTGSVVVNVSGSVIKSNPVAGDVAIDAVSESGSIAVNIIGSASGASNRAGAGFNGTGANGTALRTNSGGNVVVTLQNGHLGSTTSLVALDATIAAGRTTTLRADASSIVRGDIRAVGGGRFIVESNGRFEDLGVDLTGLAGGSSFTFGESAMWDMVQEDDQDTQTRGFKPHAYLFSAADDSIVNAGTIFIGGKPRASGAVAPDSVLAFGGGNDSFTNSGILVINAASTIQPLNNQLSYKDFAGATVFTGLETFTNSGLILLGSRKYRDAAAGTDRWYDDVLSMPGTRWIGDGGEVVMDVNLNGFQPDCTTRNADGDLGAADCIMLVGGSTEGVTNLTLLQTIPGDRGRYDPDGILLVDVAGGTSAQGHFVVGPNTPGYSSAFGGSIDKGVFNAFVVYDEATQQHRLVSLPGPTAQQFPMLATAAQGLWRTTTGSWFDRQAELRGEQQKGLRGGVWLRASGERADRDVLQSFEALGQTVTSDNSYKQTNMAINGGVDIIAGSGANSAWVVGLMGGYGRGKMRFDNSPNRANLEGYTFGGYASLLSGGLYVDAAVNANILELEEDAPGLNLFPAGTLLHTDVKSIGAQIEAGYRLPLNSSGLFVEPQLGLAWVRSDFKDMVIPADDPTRQGVIAVFDDPTSFRGTLGARVGIEGSLGSARGELSLLGRVAKEFKGENRVILQNRGPDALLTDRLDGEFGEVALRATVSSANQGVAGIFTIGGKFQSGYSAGTVSVGVRARW